LRRLALVIIVLGLLAAAERPARAAADGWRLVLRSEVRLPVGPVRLGDVVSGEVPEAAASLVVAGAGQAGESLVLDRRRLLRELVTAGLAAGVRCSGAERCRVRFAGSPIERDELESRLREILTAWLPEADPAAPPPWLEFQVRVPDLCAAGAWRLELVAPRRLAPGRNLVAVAIHDAGVRTRFTVTVLCHFQGEIAAALAPIPEDTPLTEELFRWEWRDLVEVERGVVVGRGELAGKSAVRDIAGGEVLRLACLTETPLVRRGEPVELRIRRGEVAAITRAVARQDGLRGQTITVRNELTGRLVTARIVGPGLVEWQR
jgi:flagella basal body P-ring formation protein FlgA